LSKEAKGACEHPWKYWRSKRGEADGKRGKSKELGVEGGEPSIRIWDAQLQTKKEY